MEQDDPVPPSDGVQPVGDGEDGAVRELSPDRLLDLLVRGAVHGGRGLVQHEDLGPPEESPGQADQLLLPQTEAGPGLTELLLEAELA